MTRSPDTCSSSADAGVTLSWLVDELKRRGAASVEIFALLEKPARRKVDVH